jgi:LPPG:FO 2-phospho-L-lactate transferase
MSALAGTTRPGSVVALAGGVGAARFLRGLVRAMPPDEVVTIVNTGDDCEFYNVHVSPDLDIVTYTLAGVVDPKLGYGLSGDTFTLVDGLAKLGHETWFHLGDRDYANCLHRTLRLAGGAGLAEITDELRHANGVETRILPMSEDPCPTLVELEDGRRIHFEEYLVRYGAPDAVRAVNLSAAERASPSPGVLEALHSARAIILCPSNPVVSIGPILAVPAIRRALSETAAPVVAISPIIGNAAVKGPAAQLLRGTGSEVSARGVARRYRNIAGGMLIDRRDAEQVPDVEALGLRCRAVDTLMIDREVSTALARAALDLAESLA